MTYQLIEINKLDRSPLNVRKTESHAALEELKASILAHGLMQNLVVVPAKKGKYHVIAGGRRLEALRWLQVEGKLPSDHAVQCQVAESEQAVEMSLAENTVRQAMHPADEFEAFAALIEQGRNAADIASRFGVTERHVLQRLKLGRVAPKLLAAYRAEEVTLDALMAFAVSDDHKRQISVWKSLEGWQENNARQIRQRLTDTMTEADDGMVAFVGLDAYKAAGGTVKADLFSEEVYLEDAALLQQLAGEKLNAEAEKLRAEGWGWVEVENDDSIAVYRCRRIHPKPVNAPAELAEELAAIEAEQEQIDESQGSCDDDAEMEAMSERWNELNARYRELQQQLQAYTAYDPEEMKQAGCLVSIGNDGELDIERGLVKPEDREAATEDDDDTAALSIPPKKEKPEFSQSLLADLKAYRTQAAQVEVASHPEIAFDLLAFHAACDALSLASYCRDGLDVHFRKTFPKPSVEAKNAATEQLHAIKEALPLAWLEVDGQDERFNAFRELAQADKLRILAYCTALTLKPDLAGEGEFPSAYETALALTGGSVEGYWRPTKDNYLSRVTREQLLAIGGEVFGASWASWRKGAKKGDLATALHADFAKPDGVIEHYKKFAIRLTEESVARLKDWLPKGMAFRAATQPAEPVKKAARKGRKAA